MENQKITPVRKQYLEIKRDHADAILFFRLGDFYETFDHDAEITSEELDIVLTARRIAKGQKVPMAGIPYHAAENYISRLISKGYHVAICEQIGEQPEKGLFSREVVRIVTPGTIVEPGLLISSKNNYLAAIAELDQIIGFAFVDITTGEFSSTEFSTKEINLLHSEIARINPSEILISRSCDFSNLDNYHLTSKEEWFFTLSRSREALFDLLKVKSLDGFGFNGKLSAICAAGAIVQYLEETEPLSLKNIKKLNSYQTAEYMILDPETRRSLELVETMRSGNEEGSLLSVIDSTVNPLGKRLIRNWINKPLTNSNQIRSRLDSVEYFSENGLIREEIKSQIKLIADLERIATRIRAAHAQPRDLVALRSSLRIIPTIKDILKAEEDLDSSLFENLHENQEIERLLTKAITEDPPATLQKTGVIKKGYSNELDKVFDSSKNARNWISNLEKTEKQRTGIKTLKVGFNKVFGYYLEISNSYLDKVPKEYIRKQTLVNAERFITPEMKEYESIILNADEQIHGLEQELFKEICYKISNSIEEIIETSHTIALIDVFISYATIAIQNNYCKPIITDEIETQILNGRHPVVEKTQLSKAFIPNDIFFTDTEFIRIITGPNMSGKSTFLRQTAIIILLAQIGCFVPADKATIGVVDRIFTRIGAQDEIHAGQSTFMVEMTETANILHNATNRSLLILDEIGRGTSTYDGLSIAWAVLEYIHNHPDMHSRTLFATHYHELTQLGELLPNAANYNVAVSEMNGEVVFLYKIIEGSTDRSYGIHVAQIAGIPQNVISRSYEILSNLEAENSHSHQISSGKINQQMALFPKTNPIIEELEKIDINQLSPIEALNKLYLWKKKYNKDKSEQ